MLNVVPLLPSLIEMFAASTWDDQNPDIPSEAAECARRDRKRL
jgi:hypothetical protein